MAVTRIKNNQITDSTIVGSAKIQSYSITGGLLSNNLTYGSNFTVSGNLTVQGNTTTIDTNITTIEDPVIVLASTQTGAPTVDIGFIGERGSSQNIAFVWDESQGQFITAFTSTAETETTITVSSYASFKTLDADVTGNLTVTGTSGLTGNITTGNILVSANKTIDVGNNKISNVAEPVANADAATKSYVDSQVSSGVSFDITDGVTTQTISNGDTITFAGVANETTVVVSATDNITIGLPDDVIITANLTANRIQSNTTISATGNVLSGNVIASGNVDTVYLNATNNVTGANILTAGQVSAAGNITGGNIMTGGGTGGNITGANVISATTISATGNVTAGNVNTTGLATAGNIYTAGTANVGILEVGGNATITGNVSGGNLLTGGLISSTGNVIAGNVNALASIVGNNLVATNTISAGSTISAAGNITGGNVNTVGNVTGGNLLTGGMISTSGNVNGAGAVFTGNVTAANFLGNVTGNISGNLTVSGQNTQVLFNDDGLANASAGFTFNKNSNVLTVSGNIVGGNISTDGQVSVLGNVLGNNLNAVNTISAGGNVAGGNLRTAGLVSAAGNVTAGNVTTGGQVSAVANVIGGNITTVGLISATGTITSAANVIGGNLTTAGQASATGNVIGGNVETAGQVSATGNITGGNVVTGTLTTASGDLTINAAGGDLDWAGTGNVRLGNRYINWLADPVQNQDAATKMYVDNMVSTAISYHDAVFAATVANLATTTGGTITYNQPNGAGNGIGATITTTGSFDLIDTANVQTANTRILVKNEGNAALNGVYVWSNATAITRSTDTNTYGAGNVDALGINDYFFVQSGNVNKGSAYIVDAPTGTITFGTSNIEFAQFSSSQTYTANTAAGIVLNGTVFSAKVDNDTTAFDGGGNIGVKAGANLVTPNIGNATGNSLTLLGNGAIQATTVSVTGNVTGGNLVTSGKVSATGNIDSAANIYGANILTGGVMSAAANVTGGNVITGGLITAAGNVQAGNLMTGGVMSATGNVNGAGGTFTGNITAANFLGNISGNVTAAGSNTQILFNDDGITNATAGLTFNKTSNVLTVTGNISGGNLVTAGQTSATGNITGGNVLTGGLMSATGNITASGNISGTNLLGIIRPTGGSGVAGIIFPADPGGGTGDAASIKYYVGTGEATVMELQVTNDPDDTIYLNASGGTNVASALNIAGPTSASGNVTGGNILTGGLMSATGNITGGNITTAGLISATGNITGNYIIGNGSLLTGIDTTQIQSGTSNVKVAAVNGNVTTSVSGVSNVVVVNSAGGDVAGYWTATGNVTGANLFTGGSVSAAGNVTGNGASFSANVSAPNFVGNVIGNISGNITVTGSNTQVLFNDSGLANAVAGMTFDKTSNLFTVAGNVVGGNLVTAGLVSAGGNVTGANVNTAGLVSAGGNVLGNNLVLSTGIVDGAAAGRITINGSSADTDFAVNGDTVANVLYVDAGTGTASFGSSTQTTNALVAFNATNSILLPVGNTAQRPSVGVTGMIRFNTTTDDLEVYDADGWKTAGAPPFTVIVDDQFNGDGSTTAFVLSQAATTAGVVVSINGVVQIPTTAYSVSSTTLTFTEAPLSGDVIDVRIITTTSTITSIENASGNASVAPSETAASVLIKGNIIPTSNATFSIGSSSSRWVDATLSGNVIATTVKTTPVTVAGLPAAATAGAGSRAFVTDADSITFGNLVVGGAANNMPVWSNGTSWYIG